MRKFPHIIIFSILLMVLFLAGCSSEESAADPSTTADDSGNSHETTPSEEDKYGGTVKIAFNNRPSSIGYPPALFPPLTDVPVAMPALETLGRYNSDGTMGPWLALEWEENPEAKTITIKLRDGVKFHDGTDFNAEAVKWNFEKAIEAKRTFAQAISSIEVVDPLTVEFHLDTWNSDLLETMLWQLPMASPTAFEEHGEEWMMWHPVGTGPFVFDSMQNDVFVKYVRNENYWMEGRPYLDSIEMRFISDDNTALNAFLGKEIDVITEIEGSYIDRFKDTDEFDIVPIKTAYGLEGIGFIPNSLDPDSPFSDVRVRKAVTYAIDREQVVNAVMRGFAETTNQLGIPDSPQTYSLEVEDYEYNPEKAKALLAEAGYPNGFKTDIHGMPANEVLMQAVAGFLADVGIEAKINVHDRARYLDMYMTSGWDGLLRFVYTTEGSVSRMIDAHFGPNVVQARVEHVLRPQKLLDLLTEMQASTNTEDKERLKDELLVSLMDEYHLFNPLYVATTPYLKHKYVHDDGLWEQNGMYFAPESIWTEKK